MEGVIRLGEVDKMGWVAVQGIRIEVADRGNVECRCTSVCSD